MADIEADKKEAAVDARLGGDVALGVDDAGAIPKGTIDPVYEAKARVLNRAVSHETVEVHGSSRFIDTGYWHGLVSMAAVHRHWIRMGL